MKYEGKAKNANEQDVYTVNFTKKELRVMRKIMGRARQLIDTTDVKELLLKDVWTNFRKVMNDIGEEEKILL